MALPLQFIILGVGNGSGKPIGVALVLAGEPRTPTRTRSPKACPLTTLIQQAGREAVLDHKRKGVSVSTWQDGKLVIVQPEEIEVSEG